MKRDTVRARVGQQSGNTPSRVGRRAVEQITIVELRRLSQAHTASMPAATIDAVDMPTISSTIARVTLASPSLKIADALSTTFGILMRLVS